MTPITERLAEALRPCPNGHNAKMHRCKYGVDSLYASGWFYVDCEIKECGWHCGGFPTEVEAAAHWNLRTHPAEGGEGRELTFNAFRAANVARCIKWHPAGIASWSPSDWLTAVTGELGELASLLKMRNRERDGLPGNKFSPTDKQVADELADVLIYLDLLAAVLGVDLGRAAVAKFNEVSERVGFPDRIPAPPPQPVAPEVDARDTGDEETSGGRYPFDDMGNKIDHEAGDRTKNFLREIGVAPSQLLPVAPERGEAKAVALSDDEIAQAQVSDARIVDDLIATTLVYMSQFGQAVAAHGTAFTESQRTADERLRKAIANTQDAALSATPQPPPAPGFRDPTIEDARVFYDVHTSGDVPENMDEIYARVLAALNAIGAKVEEA